MEVEAVRSSGATLTEALAAAQRQMQTPPTTQVTSSKETGSGFFARLLGSINAEPSWNEHPWQVGVNRHSMKVVASRWVKKQSEKTEENLAPSSATEGKSVQPKLTTPAPPAQRTESIVLPSPTSPKVPTVENKNPATEAGTKKPEKLGAVSQPGEQTYGYGLEDVLPKELLDQSQLRQKNLAETTPTKIAPLESTPPVADPSDTTPVVTVSPEPPQAAPPPPVSASPKASLVEAPSLKDDEFEAVPPPKLSFPQSEAPGNEVSWEMESALSKIQSMLVARVYDQAALLSALQGSYGRQRTHSIAKST